MNELIVDGYNVIHGWPELAPLIRRGHAEEARHRLVAMLGEYAAATGEQVTVVFDAHRRVRDGSAPDRVDGVTVIFGSTAQTADHVIERHVAIASQRGDAGRVMVATGDRLQRDLVMAMGGAVIGVEALRQVVLGARADTGAQSARRRREAGFANRLEDRLDPDTRAQLERLRRGRRDDDGAGLPAPPEAP